MVQVFAQRTCYCAGACLGEIEKSRRRAEWSAPGREAQSTYCQNFQEGLEVARAFSGRL